MEEESQECQQEPREKLPLPEFEGKMEDVCDRQGENQREQETVCHSPVLRREVSKEEVEHEKIANPIIPAAGKEKNVKKGDGG